MRKTGVLRRERGHLSGADGLKRRVCKRQSRTVLGDAVTRQGAMGTNRRWEALMRCDVQSVHPENGQIPDERPEGL